MEISEPIIREAVKEACNELFTASDSNEALFIDRMYSQGLGRYSKRLESIKFQNRRHVLDAGCGYGQWALALSMMNEQVLACDIDDNRLAFLENLTHLLDIKNIKIDKNALDNRIYPPNHFDAIFCYSVLYKTEWTKSLNNIAHSLSPGGLVYICSNGLGWYLYNYHHQHNAARDYNPRQHAIGSIQKSIGYCSMPNKDNHKSYDMIIPSDKIVEHLGCKFQILYKGREGGADLNQCVAGERTQSFFIGEFEGVEAVYEIVARKNPTE
jgi:SAM-dependent methyltransferase